ncbi:MAG: GGDEF domain-containing protein [Magnetococcales bacterium]|nr:GGDEF domain-containing protein [Magnetococcales bacterium]
MISQDLIPYLVEMTGQSDRIGLISQLIKTLHKFTSASMVRYFDLHQKAVKQAEPGKLLLDFVLFEPLCPKCTGVPIEDIPALSMMIRQSCHSAVPVTCIESDAREQIIFSLIDGSKIKSLLLLNTSKLSIADETTAHLLWGMFVNLERTIRAKDQDPLTGLLNRRSFDETISTILDNITCISEPNRLGGAGACLAVFDIDHFKRVNDTFGHAIGDEVLILFARQMERMFRVADILYRFGGEEFLVLLLDVDLDKAWAALERFRESIASHHFPQVQKVTVSIGFVMVNDRDFPSDLIEKADRALYYSKENGRNQINCFDELVRQGVLADIVHGATHEVEVWDEVLPGDRVIEDELTKTSGEGGG